MKIFSLLFFLLVPLTASAEIFQCTKNGKTAFQDTPCDSASRAKDLTESLSVKSISSWDSVSEGMSVCRPKFQMASSQLNAGTAFILGTSAKSAKAFLVTAHHLFGPSAGLAKQLSSQEVSEAITGAKCEPLSPRGASITAGRPIPVMNARALGENGDTKDIAVLPIMETPNYVIKLSGSLPKVGDPVWLVARVASGAPENVFLHKGLVTRSDKSRLEFAYENKGINLTATSGGPIVNEKGEAVGINLGAKQTSTGLVGIATGLGIISDTLSNIQ